MKLGRMLGIVKFTVGLLLMLAISFPAMAGSGLYKCVDNNKHVYYQDKLCQEMASENLSFTLAKAFNEGDQHAFFWKATNGKGVLYLFGSLHFGAQSFYPLPQIVNDAFNRSDVLVVESDIHNLSGNKAMESKLSGKGRYTDKNRLEGHVKPATWDRTVESANKQELNDELLSSAKPWLAALMLDAKAMKREGYTAEQGIDNFYTEQAKDKKPVIQLENEENQINLLDQLPDQEQEQILLNTLQVLNRSPEYHKSIVSAWKKGDAEGMDLIVRQNFDAIKPDSKLFNALFTDRNERIANRLADLSNDGRFYFVLVGSDYLGGEKGVLKFLGKKGFIVTQP